ncbi:MAG: DUF4007 family protein [Cyclobacteriaceae bacterium]
MSKLTFSGHESFHCRQFWLKKGYDFLASGKKFSEESSVVDLGVGKNMVTSIRFWMKSFGLTDDKDKLTNLAVRIFDDRNGWDPYLEDEGTLWLLHYNLTRNSVASIYNLIFNELRKVKPEFDRKHFYSLVSSRGKFSEATLTKDFQVFQNTYLPSKSTKDIEDSYSGILTELGLVFSKRVDDKNEMLVIEGKRRSEVPAPILLYAIIDNDDYGLSIDFDSLYNEVNSIGTVFALSREGLTEKLEEIAKTGRNITFKNEAGIRELQFKSKPRPFDILTNYYGR